jgi:general secretion pathway protein F
VLAGLLLLGLGGLLVGLRQPSTRWAIDRHAVRARYLLGIPLGYHAAQFCRNLGMLLEGGLPLNRALELAGQAVANRYLRDALAPVTQRVRQGRSLRNALEEAAILPRITIEFVAVGEETGRLAPMLNEAAAILDREVQIRLDRLSALLLPVLTIVLGLVVAAIMAGVVSGIFAANDLALAP